MLNNFSYFVYHIISLISAFLDVRKIIFKFNVGIVVAKLVVSPLLLKLIELVVVGKVVFGDSLSVLMYIYGNLYKHYIMLFIFCDYYRSLLIDKYSKNL